MPLLSLPIALSSQTELADDGTVALNIRFLQIVEEVSSVTDHFLKPAAAVEVVFVGFQMFCQVVDPGGENCNLNLRGYGVALMSGVLLDNGLFFVFQHGFASPFSFFSLTQQPVGEEPRESKSSAI